MRNRWMVAVVAAVLLAGAAAAQAPRSVPSHLLVEVSVLPYSEAPRMVLVPGDRTDRPAYVAEIAVRGPSDEAVLFAHKWFVVFAGEPAIGTFSSGELSVEYRIKVDAKEPRADALVRVIKGGTFLCGSHTKVAFSATKAGVQHAPGK
jgi:hypothetical protein